ncbi:MAG: flagellar basal body P-ring formation chaperone FlgA [Burkholderiales bacterium]
MRMFGLQQSALLLSLALFALGAHANRIEPIDPAEIARIEKSLKSFIDRETASLPGRVEIAFAANRVRTHGAPCNQLDPFVPQGARLWGRANIGLRCKDTNVRWNVFVPIEVRVFVPVLTAARQLSTGQTLEPGDYLLREIDITREPNGVITDPAQLDARITARPVPAGTALRADMLKIRPTIASGDLVKVVYMGSGFTIASEGKALASASTGQYVRVQMDSGRIINGMVRGGPIVELH